MLEERNISVEQAEKVLVTAALPYANGPLHLGHLAGAYIPADIYVRYRRLQGADVLFVCGSDEHGVPITIRADKENVTPQLIQLRKIEASIKAIDKWDGHLPKITSGAVPFLDMKSLDEH